MEATESLWMEQPRLESYPRYVGQGRHWDVIIIGGGITGVTCAWLLERAGLEVALFEAQELTAGATGRTSAHVTEVLDTRYHSLVKDRGEEGAALIAHACREAIDFIERTSLEQQLECQFLRVPGYLYALTGEQADELAKEEKACERAGVTVRRPLQVGLPFSLRAGLEFPRQARFQPRSYVLGLASKLPRQTCQLYEHSRAVDIADGTPCRVTFENGAWATAPHVVMATHAPLNTLWLQTRLAHRQTYVVSGPSALELPGLYWDLEVPYHYIRSARTALGQQLIVGGEDHKTGREPDTRGAFDRLNLYAEQLGVTVTHAWSAQILESVDKLPLVGRNAASQHVYVATGFAGNGLTFGTVSAHLLADACLGRRPSELGKLLEATRFRPISFRSLLHENLDYPIHLVKDAVASAEVGSVADVSKGEGKLVKVDGRRLAVFRDNDGAVHAVSSVCTHLGCHVHFNSAEKTWDCPCHGSRFSVDGGVLTGPAKKELTPVAVQDPLAPVKEPEVAPSRPPSPRAGEGLP